MICNRTGRLLTESFNIGDKSIECVKQYKYLGLVIQNNGNFNEAKKQLLHKGLKACFKLYKDVKASCPPIKTPLHLFDYCIKPIITYGCENWGVINITPKRKSLSLFDIFKDWEFEKLNLKFCKYILGVTKKYTNIAVLSELGIYPVSLLIHISMYCHRLENSPSELLSRAFTELNSIVDKTTSSCHNSWYSNLLFYSDNLGIDLNICKNLSRNKFKILLKKKHFA